MKIAFDIDNTILTQGSPDRDYLDADLIPGSVELVNGLYDDGHEIYFFTARHFKHFVYTDNFLSKCGFKYHGLVMNKISCDLYVDDKAFEWRPDRGPDLVNFINNVGKKQCPQG
jgi:hypothetical protein